ncbi:MAG: PAS domain S-box protein, partial [Mycobacteriales bacterium]
MTPITAEEEVGLLGYRMRAVRVGVALTFAVIGCLVVYALAPGHPRLISSSYWSTVGVACVAAVVVSLLPWERLLRSRYGMPALYAWSAGDIILIGALVTASGGGRSSLWVIYALTTIFLAMTFPLLAQMVLAAFTIASYLTFVGILGFGVGPAELALRAGVIALVALMASFLAKELAAATIRHGEARSEANRRAELLAEVAAASTSMVTGTAAEVMASAVDSLVRLGFEVSGLAHIDEATSTVRFSPSRGVPPGIMGGAYPADAGVTALVRKAGRTVAIADYGSYERALPALREFGLRCVLAAPVQVEGRLAAVLVAGSRRAVAVSAGEFEAVELLATATGQALAAAALDESVRLSEARLRALTEHAADVVLVLDAAARVSFASSPVLPLLGYSGEEMLGRALVELVHPGEQQPLLDLLSTAQVGEPLRGQTRLAHRDGSYRDVEVVICDLRNEPAVGGLTVTLRDVSAARAAATAASARAAQAQALAALGHQALRADGFAVLLARAPVAVTEALGVAGAAVFVLSDDRRELWVAGAAGKLRPPPGTRLLLSEDPELSELLADPDRRGRRAAGAGNLLGRLAMSTLAPVTAGGVPTGGMPTGGVPTAGVPAAPVTTGGMPT